MDRIGCKPHNFCSHERS